ncbi:MAG: YdcF family protein [Paucimonas sp.]|nr:YdcF family protein [Paucimonas sp.]
MSAGVLFSAIVGGMLLPPLAMLLLAAAGGVLMLAGRRRLGRGLVTLALVLLAVLSTPLGAYWLAHPLEAQSRALVQPLEAGAQAIVILGGSRAESAPEYGGRDQPSLVTLARLRYGALLQQRTGSPVLLTGGSPDGREEAEAVLMGRVMRESFMVPVRWEETRSDNTAQNATYSAALLKQAGVSRILLVTDAIHMPRARRMFEATGLDVIPAPTSFSSEPRLPLGVLPGAGAMERSRYALHEWLGLLWYRVRYLNW